MFKQMNENGVISKNPNHPFCSLPHSTLGFNVKSLATTTTHTMLTVYFSCYQCCCDGGKCDICLNSRLLIFKCQK